MPNNAELRITTDIVDALDMHRGSKPTTPEPVVILAAFLDSLAKSYGLSESGRIDEDPLGRISLPPAAGALISHYLADGAAQMEADAVRSRLYHVFVELSGNVDVQRALNKSKPLTELAVLHLAQVYWNLEGNYERPKLPIRPRAITVQGGGSVLADIPVTSVANKDFAIMNWTARVNEKAEYKSSGQAFRKQGACLAVLAANHIVEANPTPPPSLGDAVLRDDTKDGGSGVSIVWPTPGEATQAEREPFTGGCSGRTSIATITSRARAHYAIDSLEQDLRNTIDHFVRDELSPEEVFGPAYERLRARVANTESETQTLTQYLTQYLSLQDSRDVLLRCADALPPELADVLRSNVVEFDNFVPVRNRVMKGRPLQPDDLAATEQFLRSLPKSQFPQSNVALKQLGSDTGWEPRRRIGSEPPDLVLHNLPDADFDDTGLLGREPEVNDIVKMVRKRRYPVMLKGEGGIGKTALALEVCYRLVDDPESPFDAIIWVSLKTERLTAAGIQEIANALRDISGVTMTLGRALDHTFHGDIDELPDLIGEQKVLIVIDNLETVHGDEFYALDDALQDKEVAFLLTSREGLPDRTQTKTVGPLDKESAEQLFRSLAKNSDEFDAAGLTSERIDDALRKLRYSPLAIRWFILSIEAGRTPTDVLRNQDELLRYCVGNVVDGLGSDDMTLLKVIQALDRPLSFDELAVISEIDIDILRRGAQRLIQRSLLVRTQAPGDNETELLSLSSAARKYLAPIRDLDVLEGVHGRERAYTKEREIERRWSADHGFYFDPNNIFERPNHNDQPVAYLLRRALREMKAGRPEAASATMTRARALNPGYFEVDRIDAFFSSITGRSGSATALYRSALSKCESETERCWIGYFYSAHLARTVRDIPDAISVAERTHAFFKSHDTAHHLGNYYFWDRRFDEGRQLIEWAIERAPTTEFKRKATTSLVECFRQWSDADLAAGSTSEALAHAIRAGKLGVELHDSGPTDERLVRAICRAVVSALRAAQQTAELAPDDEAALVKAIQVIDRDCGVRTTDEWSRLEDALKSLTNEMRTRLTPDLSLKTDSILGRRVQGTVRNVGPKYGFIAQAEFPEGIFFQAGWVRPPTRIEDLAAGSPVEFTPSKNSKGQDQAFDVALTGSPSVRRTKD